MVAARGAAIVTAACGLDASTCIGASLIEKPHPLKARIEETNVLAITQSSVQL